MGFGEVGLGRYYIIEKNIMNYENVMPTKHLRFCEKSVNYFQ